MDINGDCPFCNIYLEDIDHLFIQCPIVREVWSTVAGYCPNPTIANNHYLKWIGYI